MHYGWWGSLDNPEEKAILTSGGHWGYEVTVRAAQKLGSKIGPLQCSENFFKNIPLQCIFSKFFLHFVLKTKSKKAIFSKFYTLKVHFALIFKIRPLQCIFRFSKNRPLRAARPVGHLPWVPPRAFIEKNNAIFLLKNIIAERVNI